MDSFEKNQLIKKQVLSYLRESLVSGLITSITSIEIDSIEKVTFYDENNNMYLIDNVLWNKLPETVKQNIKSFYNSN